MAISILTATTQAAAINYTHTTSGSTDWSSIGNSTYFYDLVDKLPYYKNSSGTILEVFSQFTGGTVEGLTTFTGGLSASTYFNLPVDPDTYTTGFTYSNNNLTVSRNQGQPNLTVNISTMTGLTVNGTLSSSIMSATTMSATTYYGNGVNLTGIPDNYVTGGTYSSGTLTLNRQNGSVIIGGFSSTDTFVTGFTYSNNNLTISRNQGQTPLVVNISTMTGLTVNGNLSTTTFRMTTSPVNGYVLTSDASGNATWSNLSSTYTGNTSATCINDLYVKNLHGCSPITIHDQVQSLGSSATGTTSFAFGNNVKAFGGYSHSEGASTTAIGIGSHAEGESTTASGSYSHSEGTSTTSIGTGSHAEGNGTKAIGLDSHSEGYQTTSLGGGSHAEGYFTTASGQYSHAEGYFTTASGNYSHAEGRETTADSIGSHSEGLQTTAIGDYSHAEGGGSFASSLYSHAEGRNTVATGQFSHAEGDGTDSVGNGSHAEGRDTTASGLYSHSEGQSTTSVGDYSHAEGRSTTSLSNYSHAEGSGTTASNIASHAEGAKTVASGLYSHAEGRETTASGDYSHAEGYDTTALGDYSHTQGRGNLAVGPASHAEGGIYFSGKGTVLDPTSATTYSSHAEGIGTLASGQYSHAEGSSTIASGLGSHAEGSITVASGDYSHSEGLQTTASGDRSHAEGYLTTASNTAAHAEGRQTTATGLSSHAEGFSTTAGGDYSHVGGRSNDSTSDYSVVYGFNNSVLSTGNHNLILGGNDNTMFSTVGGNNTILNGLNNQIDIGSNSTAFGVGGYISGGSYNYHFGQGSITRANINLGTKQFVFGDGVATVGTAGKQNTILFDIFNGDGYWDGTADVGPADYAEYFEWNDGNTLNEDRVGYFVSLIDNTDRIECNNTNVIGIVSAKPALVGDSAFHGWKGMYLTDEWGRNLIEEYDEYKIKEEYIDENSELKEKNISIYIDKNGLVYSETPNTMNFSGTIYSGNIENKTFVSKVVEKKVNPDYDPNQSYVSRKDRPEWSAIGLLGKLRVRTAEQITGSTVSCDVNGMAINGSDYHVLETLKDYDGNYGIIKILFK